MTDNHDSLFDLRRFGGMSAGPDLVVTAGVHGDEYLPMLVIRKLIERFESQPNLASSLHGTVTLIPVVNRAAFRRGDRVGDDGKDLARTCPGRKHGTTTERVAHALSEQISKADYYLDLHTGGTELCVLPLAGYVLHTDKAVLQQQREMARAFGLPFIWGTSADLQGRTLSVARDAGVPAIYVEYLGADRELAEVAAGEIDSERSDHPLVAGCFNLMRHLKLLDQPVELREDQEVIEDQRPGSGHMQVCNPAPATGWLTPKVILGQRVRPGDPLAEIVTETGNAKHCVVSDQDGIVVVVRQYPRVLQGDTVAVIAQGFGVT